MMTLKTYHIIPKALSLELCKFLTNYFLLKRKVAELFFKSGYISPFSKEWGGWSDTQVPMTYAHYGDVAMDILLPQLQPLLEKKLKLKLYPTYTFARIYKKGDILARHKDRRSCEISATLRLGGDEWPIFLDPSGADFVIDESKNIIKPGAPKGVRVDLKVGDMLIYEGCEMEHWRKKFKGKECVQLFLHYNKVEGGVGERLSNLYDGRPHLGLPSWYIGWKDEKK